MKIIRPATFVEGSTVFSRAGNAWYWDKNGVLQTAGANTPRWTYDPLDLAKAPCALVEPAATNLITYSSNLSTGWTGSASATPSGLFFGSLPYYYVTKTNSGTSEFRQHYVGAKDAGQTVVATLALRAGSIDSVSVGLYDWTSGGPGWGSAADAQIEIVGPGTVYAQTGGAFYISGLSSSVDTFIKITRVYQLDATSTALLIYPGTVNSSTIGHSVQATRVQVEVGRATSYIPTAGVAVTRVADVLGDKMVSLLAENEYPAWSATKLYAAGDRVLSTATHRVYESTSGLAATGLSVTGASGSPLSVSWPSHALAVGDYVVFTAGPLTGSGLSLNTAYRVASVIDSNAFTLNASQAGGTSSNNTGISATGGTNYNVDPTAVASAEWLDAGPTNRYAVLDASVSTQASAADYVGAVFPTSGGLATDSVVLQNVDGYSARVTLTSATDGPVYDQVVSLVQDLEAPDYWSYCFEPITRKTDVMFTGLPPYMDAALSISVASVGQTAKAGLFTWGLSKDFGPTQAGMSIGIQDYSVKSVDEFGNFTLLERPYSKTMALSAYVERSSMTALINLLTSLRATPAVYVGDEAVSASFQYGFAKDWSMGADYPDVSILHIEIESLT